MKEFYNSKMEVNREEAKEEVYSIPDESSCSAEFSEGCIFID